MAELKIELQKLKMEVRKLHSSFQFQGRSKPTLKPEMQQNSEQLSDSFVTNAVFNLDFYPPVKTHLASLPPACLALDVFRTAVSRLPYGYYKAYDNTTDSFSYVYCDFE